MNEGSESGRHILDVGDGAAVHGGAYFSMRHRIYRAMWNVTWLLLASWTPPPMHAWRRVLLRLFGAKIGRCTRIYGSARIWYPPNLEMGDYSVLGWKVNCYSQGAVILEEYANVAQYVHLVTGTHDIDDPNFQLYTKPIRICRNAWIASDAFVGPGVVVGEGAVLGGRGVAFKNLDPWTVYVGNPARAIKKRQRFARVERLTERL
jgi:putative colanic acid biosynthesis acetyltransferase WcaF